MIEKILPFPGRTSSQDSSSKCLSIFSYARFKLNHCTRHIVPHRPSCMHFFAEDDSSQSRNVLCHNFIILYKYFVSWMRPQFIFIWTVIFLSSSCNWLVKSFPSSCNWIVTGLSFHHESKNQDVFSYRRSHSKIYNKAEFFGFNISCCLGHFPNFCIPLLYLLIKIIRTSIELMLSVSSSGLEKRK